MANLSGRLLQKEPAPKLTGHLPGSLHFGVPGPTGPVGPPGPVGPAGPPGLTAEAKQLLITILQAAVYTSNQAANIKALATELGVELEDDPGTDEPDVPVIPKLNTPVIRLETAEEPDEPIDPEEITPAILGVAILGRTILGDYGGTVPKLTAPVIQLVTVSDPVEPEIQKLTTPVIRLETETEPEPDEPATQKLTTPEIELVVLKLEAPVIELVEV